MKSTVIVLSAKPWDMVDDVTKATRSGVSLHYVMTDNLKPKVDSESGELGYSVMKESISLMLPSHWWMCRGCMMGILS